MHEKIREGEILPGFLPGRDAPAGSFRFWMVRYDKLEFITQLIDVTFLFPNKKVTKEVGIGEALMPRSRAPNALSPMYPSRAQRKDCETFSRRDGTSVQLNDGGGWRSRRPAVFPKTFPCAAKIGTFLLCTGCGLRCSAPS